jgi:type VI secretion system protein VasG
LPQRRQPSTNDQAKSANPLATGLTTDLTQLGREGRLRENLNLESETLQLIKVLGGNGSRQPMILDLANQSQDALVEQLAIRIANGSVPALSGKRILKLESPTLFSHSKSDREAEAKLNAVIDNAIASKGNDILFIDRFAGTFSTDALRMKFIAAVSTGKLKIIGGNNFEEYKEVLKDGEIAKLFETIKIGNSPTTPVEAKKDVVSNSFRGDNISPDLAK